LAPSKGSGSEQLEILQHIVCRNEEEAKRDASDRQSILDSLARQLGVITEVSPNRTLSE
jgi:hypothetical protein